MFSSTFGFEEMRLSASVWEDGEGGRGQVEGSIPVDIKSGRIEKPSSSSAPEMEVRFKEESEDRSAAVDEERDGIC
jgi:hypothetical protein